MPTYAYACTACDHRFETVQAFSDATLTDCPECTGRLRKLFNSVGIVFKGSGFYRTDSRDGGRTAGATTSGEGSSEGSVAAKSDAPAEKKTESAKSAGAKSDGAKSDVAGSGTKTTTSPAAATSSPAA